MRRVLKPLETEIEIAGTGKVYVIREMCGADFDLYMDLRAKLREISRKAFLEKLDNKDEIRLLEIKIIKLVTKEQDDTFIRNHLTHYSIYQEIIAAQDEVNCLEEIVKKSLSLFSEEELMQIRESALEALVPGKA